MLIKGFCTKKKLLSTLYIVTGNPRNKCALKPGHSLMDWIRLGASGKDLTGVGSQAGRLSVTRHELSQHITIDDIWLAIRGRVYNVTSYIPFHPGGPDELMRAAGIDATKLFDQVHPWVNYEQILQKCYIGRLVSIDPGINTEDLFLGKQETKKEAPRVETAEQSAENTPKKRQSGSAVGTSSCSNSENGAEVLEVTTPDLPRFDWIQKLNEISIIFYTPAFCNPMVEVIPPSLEKYISIIITYDETVFKNELVFSEDIVWPCKIKVTCETGKVEVFFQKNISGIWRNYGVLRQSSESVEAVSGAKFTHILVDKVQVTHNTYLMKFERTDERKIVVPIGRHVRAFVNIDGQEWSRSYTNVPSSLFTSLSLYDFISDNVCLMIKRYENGNVSRILAEREKNDVVYLSAPLGDFELKRIEKKEAFLLIAAGSGITPMLALLVFLLERRIKKCQFVRMLFFNKTQHDIPFRSQLDNLESNDQRLRIDHVLSQPDKNWLGLTGHVNKDLIENSILEHIKDTGYTIKDMFAFVCGPKPFVTLSMDLLQQIGLQDEQVHLFQG
ncbi:hypothetical protein JTB14_007310 [Gonioctena quinquepunctata]|nr:hypothetical protein JTB14_007310 [Gonioctena quinquepunctata]